MSSTISLCMIVRNSEGTLRQALASVQPFVDEMIVVDTGSEDGTVALAGELGARVFHFPWVDDFSAARNDSISHATGDWIYWMDSDDQLPDGEGPKLRQLVESCPELDRAFRVTVEEQYTGSDGQKRTAGASQCRLFPRRDDIRFEYRVHEQVLPAIGKAGLQVAMSDVRVRHANADRSGTGNARRLERNLRLLKLDLDDRPDDAFVLLNLGMSLLEQGKPEPAINYIRNSLDGFPEDSPTRLNAWLRLAAAHKSLNDPQAVEDTLIEAQRGFSQDLNLMFRLGDHCELTDRPDEAIAWYQRALTDGRLDPSVLHQRDVKTETALRLGRLLHRAGRTGQAEQAWLGHLEQYPRDWKVRRELIELYIRTQRDESAEQQIELLPDHPRLEQLRVSLRGCVHVLRENWAEARADLLSTWQSGFRDPMQLHGLSVTLLILDDMAGAETVLRELIQREPNHPHAAANLALVCRRTGRAAEADMLLAGQSGAS